MYLKWNLIKYLFFGLVIVSIRIINPLWVKYLKWFITLKQKNLTSLKVFFYLNFVF